MTGIANLSTSASGNTAGMIDDPELYIVSVDSRGHSIFDMECYKEYTCRKSYFQKHVIENPKNHCVKSKVARLCGLELKLYFHEHTPYRHVRNLMPSLNPSHMYTSTCPKMTNVGASLLTFDPNTGLVPCKIYGKAYIVMEDGTAPLSKEQVWGLEEFIKEARDLYLESNDIERCQNQLVKLCAQYKIGCWVPKAIYEKRRPILNRGDSDMTDQATCHHGETHIHHHNGSHCCGKHGGDESRDENHCRDNVVLVRGDDNHHPLHPKFYA
jgi:hypothetical protein